MNGWQRLWVVSSILLGVPLLLVSEYPSTTNGSQTEVGFYEVPDTADKIADRIGCSASDGFTFLENDRPSMQRVLNAPTVAMNGGRSRPRPRPDLPLGEMVDAVLPTYDVFVTCERWTIFQPSFLVLFLPGLVLGAVGYAVGWIYRGFKPKP